MNIEIPPHLEGILKVESIFRDGVQMDYIKRIQPEKIKHNMKQEFDYILTSLLPDWKTDCKDKLFDGDIDIDHYDEDATGQLCICTKDISRICVIKHRNYNTRIQVGIDCIEKINPELYKKATAIQRQYKKQKKLEIEFRKCITCNEYNISKDEPDWKKDCVNCFKINLIKNKDFSNTTYRLCSSCKKYKIVITEPDWKKDCYTCYKQK